MWIQHNNKISPTVTRFHTIYSDSSPGFEIGPRFTKFLSIYIKQQSLLNLVKNEKKWFSSKKKPQKTQSTCNANIFQSIKFGEERRSSLHIWGPPWSWSYGIWIYNYLYNHCISPLKLWVRIPIIARCTQYNIMW